MKTRIAIGTIVLGYAIGCSNSEAPPVAAAVEAVASTADLAMAHTPSIAPSEPITATAAPLTNHSQKQAEPPPPVVTDDTPASDSKPTTQTLDISELFAPPREAPVVKPPEPTPPPPTLPAEIAKPTGAAKPLPTLRLVGFTESDSLKAILSIDGKLNLLAAGESAEGIDIVSMSPPSLTLKHADKELELNMMDQPWSEVASAPNEAIRPGPGPASRPVRMPGVPPSRTAPSPPPTREPSLKDGRNWAAAPVPPSVPGIPGK